jgi:hypothetical protein
VPGGINAPLPSSRCASELLSASPAITAAPLLPLLTVVS